MRTGSRGRLGGRKNGNQRLAHPEISRARRKGPVVECRALRGTYGVGGVSAECTHAAAQVDHRISANVKKRIGILQVLITCTKFGKFPIGGGFIVFEFAHFVARLGDGHSRQTTILEAASRPPGSLTPRWYHYWRQPRPHRRPNFRHRAGWERIQGDHRRWVFICRRCGR